MLSLRLEQAAIRFRSADFLQYVHAHGSLFDADVSPAVFGQPDARLLHLPFTRVAAQLQYQLVYLGQARGAYGVPAALQPAAGVDGFAAAYPGGPRLSKRAAFAHGTEAHDLGLVQFPPGRGIVKLSQADIAGSQACKIVGLPGQPLAYVLTVQRPVAALSQDGGNDPCLLYTSDAADE